MNKLGVAQLTESCPVQSGQRKLSFFPFFFHIETLILFYNSIFLGEIRERVYYK